MKAPRVQERRQAECSVAPPPFAFAFPGRVRHAHDWVARLINAACSVGAASYRVSGGGNIFAHACCGITGARQSGCTTNQEEVENKDCQGFIITHCALPMISTSPSNVRRTREQWQARKLLSRNGRAANERGQPRDSRQIQDRRRYWRRSEYFPKLRYGPAGSYSQIVRHIRRARPSRALARRPAFTSTSPDG